MHRAVEHQLPAWRTQFEHVVIGMPNVPFSVHKTPCTEVVGVKFREGSMRQSSPVCQEDDIIKEIVHLYPGKSFSEIRLL